MQQVILGLGSNVGDRADFLARALVLLEKEIGPMVRSPVYESSPQLLPDAPTEWAMPFLNMAASCFTKDSPISLLAIAKMVEEALGRKDRGRWAPREIDIDILAVGDAVIHSRTLSIPHRELLRRDFVLVPLADVAPAWRYPTGEHQGVPAKELVQRLGFSPNESLKRVNLTLP